jgi:choline dehydrogenase
VDTFDYIIVGAGSAASVIAARLAEDGKRSLCVLEAGPPDTNPYIRIPAGFMKTLFDPSVTWQFKTEASEHIAGRQLPLVQGRTLGGSSAVNGGLVVRGQPIDFDTWAERGNPGWGYADVLPYFKRFENRIGGNEPAGDAGYRGRDGALPVTIQPFPDTLCEAFMDTAAQCGMPRNPDYNGRVQLGTGRYQAAILNGKRVSAAKAFLKPAVKRGNVDLRTNAQVSRIRFETVNGRPKAVGVDYIDGAGQTRSLSARAGVVVSAGVINSPKLLQLSGIGPAALLKQHGIEVIKDLPAVGEGLRDHYSPRVVFRAKGADSINNHMGPFKLGIQFLRWLAGQPSFLGLSPGICHAFGKTDPALNEPDFTFIFAPASWKLGAVGVLDDFPGMTCGVWRQRPESTGYVRITSKDAREMPLVNPMYMSNAEDRRILIAALKIARNLFKQQPIARHVEMETLPGPQVQTDDEWLDFARRFGGTSYHPVGSCRMGQASDPSTVVGPDLRVHGVDGLHVADSSVMPTIPSANTYAASLMIGEKAADLIRGLPPLPRAVL